MEAASPRPPLELLAEAAERGGLPRFVASISPATPNAGSRGPAQPLARWCPSPYSPALPGVPSSGPSSSRTFQTDVLSCPRCGATRRVVAVVLRSATAQAILEHLRLPSRPLPLAPANTAPSSASGERSPRLTTRPGLTIGPGLLYPHTRTQAFKAPPRHESPPLSPRGLPARTALRKPGLFFLGPHLQEFVRHGRPSLIACWPADPTFEALDPSGVPRSAGAFVSMVL
jgi:hypothetical protein